MLPLVVPVLLEALSGLEDARLNYVEQVGCPLPVGLTLQCLGHASCLSRTCCCLGSHLGSSPPPPPNTHTPCFEALHLIERLHSFVHRSSHCCACTCNILHCYGFRMEGFWVEGCWRLSVDWRMHDSTRVYVEQVGPTDCARIGVGPSYRWCGGVAAAPPFAGTSHVMIAWQAAYTAAAGTIWWHGTCTLHLSALPASTPALWAIHLLG